MNYSPHSACLLILALIIHMQGSILASVEGEFHDGHYQNYQPCGLRPGFNDRAADRRLGNSTRISNGYPATRGEFPSYASILIYRGRESGYCSGVIVGSRAIISAAHCFAGAQRVFVSATHSLNRPDKWAPSEYSRVEKYCAATNYINNLSPLRSTHDYGVVILANNRKIRYGDYVQPACLSADPVVDGQRGVSVGVGLVGKNRYPLQANALPMQQVLCYEDRDSTKGCYRAYSAKYSGTLCQGDSGGPLYMTINGKHTVVGLTSYGPNIDCNRPETVVLANVAGEQAYKMKRFIQRCIDHPGEGLIKLPF